MQKHVPFPCAHLAWSCSWLLRLEVFFGDFFVLLVVKAAPPPTEVRDTVTGDISDTISPALLQHLIVLATLAASKPPAVVRTTVVPG